MRAMPLEATGWFEWIEAGVMRRMNSHLPGVFTNLASVTYGFTVAIGFAPVDGEETG